MIEVDDRSGLAFALHNKDCRVQASAWLRLHGMLSGPLSKSEKAQVAKWLESAYSAHVLAAERSESHEQWLDAARHWRMAWVMTPDGSDTTEYERVQREISCLDKIGDGVCISNLVVRMGCTYVPRRSHGFRQATVDEALEYGSDGPHPQIVSTAWKIEWYIAFDVRNDMPFDVWNIRFGSVDVQEDLAGRSICDYPLLRNYSSLGLGMEEAQLAAEGFCVMQDWCDDPASGIVVVTPVKKVVDGVRGSSAAKHANLFQALGGVELRCKEECHVVISGCAPIEPKNVDVQSNLAPLRTRMYYGPDQYYEQTVTGGFGFLRSYRSRDEYYAAVSDSLCEFIKNMHLRYDYDKSLPEHQ